MRTPLLLSVSCSATLLAAAAASGCAPQTASPPATAAAAPPKPASLACPALASADAAALFGVDAKTAARVTQIVQLTGELKATATLLDQQTRALCTALANDLDPGSPLSTAAHPCSVARDRFVAFAKRLPAGAKLEIAVRGVTCGVPRRAL
jgi:hypothetical protein